MSDLATLIGQGHYTFYKSAAEVDTYILGKQINTIASKRLSPIQASLGISSEKSENAQQFQEFTTYMKDYVNNIRNAASRLRANEYTYINNIISQNKKIMPKTIQNKLAKLNTPDGISATDYNSIIVALNYIQYKDKINNFNKIINQQITNITNLQDNLDKLKKTGPEGERAYQDLADLYIHRYDLYIKQYVKIMEDFFKKEYKNKRRTLLQTWAKKINDTLKILQQDESIRPKIEELWQKYPEEKSITISGNDDSKFFLILVDTIVDRVINSTDSPVTIALSIIDELKHNKIQKPSLSGGSVTTKKTETRSFETEILNPSATLLSQMLIETNETKEILETLFPDQPKEVKNLILQLDQLKDSLKDRTLSPENYRKRIRSFRTNNNEKTFEEELREKLSSAVENLKITNKEQNNNYYLAKLKDFIIQNISLRLDKSGLAELIASKQAETDIVKVISNKVPGNSVKLKDDVFCIVEVGDLANLDTAIFGDNENTLEGFFSTMESTLKDTFSNFVSDYAKKTKTKKFNETDVESAHNLYIKKMEKIIELYTTIKKNNPQLYQQITEYMKSSSIFLESISVKEYDLYNDEIGFHAGTLGANVNKILTNIYNMYTAGGLSPLDVKTLEFAVLNCSDAAIGGAKLRKSLEMYLLGGAALMVFDEGQGNALAFLNKQEQDILNILPKNLNLYFLNGAYIPSSYILETIADNLEQFYQQEIDEQISNIKLTNQVVITNVPQIEVIMPDLVMEYQETAKQVLEQTDIQFIFMAGMLDIFKNLKKAFKVK